MFLRPKSLYRSWFYEFSEHHNFVIQYGLVKDVGRGIRTLQKHRGIHTKSYLRNIEVICRQDWWIPTIIKMVKFQFYKSELKKEVIYFGTLK